MHHTCFATLAGHGDMTYNYALNRALTIDPENKDKDGNSRD